jgi:hypothetical protein
MTDTSYSLSNCHQEASTRFGKRLNVAAEQKQNMIDAGFVEVEEKIIPVGIPGSHESLTNVIC